MIRLLWTVVIAALVFALAASGLAAMFYAPGTTGYRILSLSTGLVALVAFIQWLIYRHDD